MKLLVATLLLLFMIINIHGHPDPHSLILQVNQHVDTCNCGTECCEHKCETTTTEKTTTTKATTTTSFCDTLRTTLCDDGSRCHGNATCLRLSSASSEYFCQCNVGYAGDGADCGIDSDMDSWPDVDLNCCEVRAGCRADNCVKIPNSGQEDSDHDGMGDACDDTENTGITLGPTTPFTIPTESPCILHEPVNCTSNVGNDSDGDGIVDSCDNCPNFANFNQMDSDSDQVGDDCDTDQDTDNDGYQDQFDNCIDVVNPQQRDTDNDGIGDNCDDDADDDGIPNDSDNCWLVPNSGQVDADNDGVGDDCQPDFDGDCVKDPDDPCPENSKIHSVDFRNFVKVILEYSSPAWTIFDDGQEIFQSQNSDAGLMYGQHSFSGVDYDGTFFVDINAGDDDYAGFIFGYQSSKTFYVVNWKRANQTYWTGLHQWGFTGVQIKKVHSTTGPGGDLADALWATNDTPDQVTLLWHDRNLIPWVHGTSYRWQLIHRPHIGLIRVRFFQGTTVIVDSGNIIDSNDHIVGGHVGVYCHSQAGIKFSDLDYSCNDDSVPQEVYDDLPTDLQSEIDVDYSKTWAGVVRTLRKKLKPIVSYTEPPFN